MMPDLLVVGAGPAGVSAALRARVLDLSVLLLDAGDAPGGQLHWVHFHPHDVPGFEAGDGPALALAYARQLERAGVPLRMGVRAGALEAGHGAPGGRVVRLEGGEAVEAAAVLVATGVRRRRLDVPGARELEGAGVSYSGTGDLERLAGRRVAIVGGGDAAFENALILSRAGSEVTLLVRDEARARPEFVARVRAEARITVRPRTRVLAVLGSGAVSGLRIAGAGGEAELAVEAVVVKVGVVPNSEWCAGEVELDGDGYVRVDARFATSSPRVWAAGDITRPLPLSVPVALGQGAQAAATIRFALRHER